MPFYQHAKSLPQRFRLVLSSFMQHDDLPFKDTLSEERIQQAFEEEDAVFAQGEEDVYTPAITLWAFLSQVLFKGEQRSCAGHAGVGRHAGFVLPLDTQRTILLAPTVPLCD